MTTTPAPTRTTSPSRLLNLDGTPQTWDELRERLAEFWRTHDRYGEAVVRA